jgi:hypothetical protein
MNAPEPRFKRYVMRFLAWLAFGLAAVVVFGVLTDPYAFSWPHRHLDPAFRENDLEVRMNILSQLQPDVLLLGNSRAQHGLDPHNAVFGDQRVFNGAIVGGNPRDFAPLVASAERNRPLKMIVMGIDFNMLYAGEGRRNPSENLLRRSGPFAVLARIRAVLSVDALWESCVEILRYFRGTDHLLDKDGRLLEPLYQRDVAARGGTLAAVRQRDAVALYEMKKSPSGSFVQDLSSILDTACANGTRVILFSSPMHARHLEAIEQAGRWNEFVAWKRSVLDLVESKPACNIQLWDFARHSKVTEEPVPDFGPMKYYWESSHYRKIVGDAVLAATVGGQSDPRAWQAEFGNDFGGDFGERLTAANFSESMQREEAARVAWRSGNPAILSDVESLKQSATSPGE